MTKRPQTASTLLQVAIAALFATTATMAMAGADRPSRALDDEQILKFRGATNQPGRQIDDDGMLKSRGATEQPGRTAENKDEGTLKARGATDKPGRTGEYK